MRSLWFVCLGFLIFFFQFVLLQSVLFPSLRLLGTKLFALEMSGLVQTVGSACLLPNVLRMLQLFMLLCRALCVECWLLRRCLQSIDKVNASRDA